MAYGDKVVLLPGTYAVGTDPLQPNDAISIGGRRKGPRPAIVGSDTGINRVVDPNVDGVRLHDVKVRGGAISTVAFVGVSERVEAVGPFIGCGRAEVIRDSVCVSTGSFGHAVSWAAGCGGPITLPRMRLRNVTAIALGASGTGINTEVNGGCDILIEGRNVIATGPLRDLYAAADAMPNSRAEINLTYSAFDTVAKSGANAFATPAGTNENITAAPVLTNPAGGDYGQLPGSPTIDAGTRNDPHDLLGKSDLDGGRSIVGGRVDIGADEFDFACKGRSATIVGTGGAIVGTNGPDVIVGTRGRDKIRARGGNDLVCGGGGPDTIKGGGGKDRLYGQAGRDRLVGGAGKGDLCHGGAGKDRAHRTCEKVKG